MNDDGESDVEEIHTERSEMESDDTDDTWGNIPGVICIVAGSPFS